MKKEIIEIKQEGCLVNFKSIKKVNYVDVRAEGKILIEVESEE